MIGFVDAVRRLALALCPVLLGCAVVAASACAAVAPFGGGGEGAGQMLGALAIAADNGNALTSPSAGDVYVADASNDRIDKFASDGSFLLAWGWGVSDGKAEFETCGPDASPPTSECQAGIEGSGAGQLARPVGVAVDSTAGLSHGDVYVEDRFNNRVEKFSEDGRFLFAAGWGVADGKEEPQTCGPSASPPTGECRAGLEGQGAGELESLAQGTIVVSTSGAVLIGDQTRVERFSEGGAFEGQVALAGAGNEIYALAANSAGDLFAARAELGAPVGLVEYDALGAEVATLDPEAGFGTALALGPSGELFEDTGARVREYGPTGVETESFPAPPGSNGIAFDDRAEEPYALTETFVHPLALPPPGPLIEAVSAGAEPLGTATVTASIDPEGRQTNYHLVYGPQATGGASTATATMAGEGFEPETVQIELSGLEPKTVYHFHLVAENAAGTVESEDQTFQTLPPVSIDSESVAQVSSTSARLEATLNPFGLQTEYRFEYGTTSAYGASAPATDARAGSGLGDASFSLLLEGLSPSTTYHYRVVAHNSFGEEAGPDRTFTTQTAASITQSIDGRGWEQVSPPDKHGAPLEAITAEGGLIQASEDGNRLAYIARDPVQAESPGNRSFAEQQLLATRGPGGWITQEIATPHEAVAGLRAGELSEFRQFSPDLARAIVEPSGSTLLSPWATERTPYLREPDGEFAPLLSGCPPVSEPCPAIVEEHADVPPGTKFGATEEGGRLLSGTGVQFRLASSDLRHALITAPQSLTSGFETGGEEAVYEWSEGHIVPVSALPGEASAGRAGVGASNALMRNAVSASGGRAFFESTPHLFVRDIVRKLSMQVDAPEEGIKSGVGTAAFQYATPDGTKVFFTDSARLTADATVNRGGELDLYECELGSSIDEQSCAAKHNLKNLTVGADSEPAEVLGAMIGASEDGSYVYFVANGILVNRGVPVRGAVRGSCSPGEVAGHCNLYLWHDGAISLVAVLSGGDSPDWLAGIGDTDLSQLPSRVSPNGRYLAFMSQLPLTGYDNRDAISGVPDEEAFLYDSSTGTVVCASCDPTGARPVGALEPNSGSEPTALVDRVGTWSGRWVAGSVPGWTPVKAAVALYQSRYLSNEGRLFFDSPTGLVPGDANGRQDVYEFEPEGVGGCDDGISSGSAVFVAQVADSPVEGCVGLISSGSSSEDSVFLDASGTGPGGTEAEDVFFLTVAKLAGSDVDNALDVYDAHVCSAASPCPSAAVTVPPACTTTDSCRAASAPQPAVFGAPASATLAGAGNPLPPPLAKPTHRSLTRAQKLARALRVCRREPRKRRSRCERDARRAYGGARKSRKGAK